MKKLFAALLIVTLLAVSVSATGFVPSKEIKPAPEVTDNPEILPDEDHPEPQILDLGEIIITPYSEREIVENPEIKAALEQAERELSENGISTLCPDAFEQLKEMYPQLTDDDIVVRDLFDLRMFGSAYDEYFARADENQLLKATFDCNLTAEEPTPVIMYKQLGTEKWVAVPTEWITRNNNDTITVIMQSVYGPIVFLALPASIIIVDPTHTSPETGDTLALSLAAAAVAVAGTVLVIKKKKED